MASTATEIELERNAEFGVEARDFGLEAASSSADASDTTVETDGLQPYIILVAASAVLFIGVGYTNTFGVFDGYYQRELLPNDRPTKIILIGSVAASLYFILGVFMGRFADLVGYRISLMIGAALQIGAMFSASVSTTYDQLFLSQGLMFGFGVAFAYLPATTISRQYWHHRHGLANGIVVSGGAAGGCVLPYICRELLVKQGLAQTFRILGYIAAGILIPSLAFLKPKSGNTPSIRRARQTRRKIPLLDLSLLRDVRFNALLITSTIAMAGFLPRYFLIPPSAVAQGIDETYAAWLLGLMNGLSIVGRVGIGSVADRYGKVFALAASFTLCGLGHIAFWLPGVTVPAKGDPAAVTSLFTIFVVYVGILGSGFVSLFPVVVAHLFGSENLASKTGLFNTVIGISTLAGPSAIYAIVGDGVHRNWWQGVVAAGLFMLVGGVFMILTVGRWTKRDQQRPD